MEELKREPNQTPSFKNEVSFVRDEAELKHIIDYYANRPNSFLVIIQGSEVQTRADYLKAIQREFHFHYFDPPEFTDGYIDWMTDLGWLDKEEFGILFVDFKRFTEQNTSLKIAIIIEELQESILPFWEKDATRVICGGKLTPFQVYLWDEPYDAMKARGD